MTQLSAHFSLDELTFSQTATRAGIDNTPNDAEVENLRSLAVDILEPLRSAIGRPVHVTSGYRCRDLNTAIGGAKNSSHLNGMAADVVVPGLSPHAVARAVRAIATVIPLGQCIVEFGRWVHLSLAENDEAEPKFLAANLVDGKTVYSTLEA